MFGIESNMLEWYGTVCCGVYSLCCCSECSALSSKAFRIGFVPQSSDGDFNELGFWFSRQMAGAGCAACQPIRA